MLLDRACEIRLHSRAGNSGCGNERNRSPTEDVHTTQKLTETGPPVGISGCVAFDLGRLNWAQLYGSRVRS